MCDTAAPSAPPPVRQPADGWNEARSQLICLETRLTEASQNGGDAKPEIVAVLRVLRDHRYRIDDLLAASSDGLSENAHQLLDQLSADISEKTALFISDLTKLADRLTEESPRTTEWLRGLNRRLWGWLKLSDTRIAQTEHAVLFEGA